MQNQTIPFPTPAIDDRPVYDVVATKYAFPTLAMSVEIGLFEQFAHRTRTIPEIAGHLQLSQRAAEALISVAAAMGLPAASGLSEQPVFRRIDRFGVLFGPAFGNTRLAFRPSSS